MFDQDQDQDDHAATPFIEKEELSKKTPLIEKEELSKKTPSLLSFLTPTRIEDPGLFGSQTANPNIFSKESLEQGCIIKVGYSWYAPMYVKYRHCR